jgi:hypothetical protein
MPERHSERCVSPLLRREPQISELGRFGVVGTDDHRLDALVARFCIEMCVRRPRLWDVRAPQDQKSRVVPVCAFGNISLLTPGLRAGGRQIAVPVVEGAGYAADELEISGARSI